MGIQQYQADAKDIKLKCEFLDFPTKKGAAQKDTRFGPVPLKDQNHFIESDEKRIKQVLMNLQSNALKFTKSGGQIKIIAQMVKGTMILSKKDKQKSQL